MNGYSEMAKIYRKAAKSGEISSSEAEKQARVYEFLGACDQEDFYRLFDSGAFNAIAMSYLRLAVRRLSGSGVLTEEQSMAVRREVDCLYSEMTAADVEGMRG